MNPTVDDSLHSGSIGIVTQLENKVRAIPRNLQAKTTDLNAAVHELDAVQQRIGQPSPHSDALAHAQSRVDDIDAQLHARMDEPPSPSRRTKPQRVTTDRPSQRYEPPVAASPATSFSWR